MKYRNEDDNRYWVNFMPATEELMKKLTVSQFIEYLEDNAELEDEDREWIDGCVVGVKIYLLCEARKLHKEFIVTEDGRLFYWRTVNHKVELVDEEKACDEREAKAMARFNKEKFLKSELGNMWVNTAIEWDYHLSKHDDSKTDSLQGKHEAIQLAVKQFYGVEYHFTRTDDYYGLVTEDGLDWLYRVDKADKENLCELGRFNHRVLNEDTAQKDGYADIEMYGVGGGNTKKIYKDTPIPKRDK